MSAPLNATANDWPRILREVDEQVRAELIAAEITPLEYGRVVAWVECHLGKTDRLGVVHRVGVWNMDHPRTICGDLIPDAKRRLALSPSLVRTLGQCRYCAAEYAQSGVAA